MVDKQFKFLLMISDLIHEMQDCGYQATAGCFRCLADHHKSKSLHKLGLAADINLFRNGKYLTETIDHEQFGLIWESWGGSWGGRFGDGNHYSLEHDGMR